MLEHQKHKMLRKQAVFKSTHAAVHKPAGVRSTATQVEQSEPTHFEPAQSELMQSPQQQDVSAFEVATGVTVTESARRMMSRWRFFRKAPVIKKAPMQVTPDRTAPGKSAAASHKPLVGFERWLLKLTFSTKTRMRLYEKIGKFIANGVPITHALDEIYVHVSVEGKKPKAAAARVVDEWRRSIRNGRSFARAISGWATAEELSVLDAGEISGRLDKAIDDVMFINLARKRIRGAVFGLVYPMVLVGTTCLYLYIFGTQVVPAFARILPVERWQGAGVQMAMLSKFVLHGLAPLLVICTVLLVVIMATLGRWTGRARQAFDKVPPWSLYRLAVGSSFLISLAALLHAGVAVPEALRIMHATGSPWYRERLAATRRMVLNGARNIGDALHKTGYQFPSWEMVIDIRSYASLDGFEDMLDRLSRQWLDESVAQIQTQMDVLRNVAIVVMGLVFIWIASGMIALQMQISNAVH
jgi:type II secretory pathway component PulF